jgi:hypothetical protein
LISILFIAENLVTGLHRDREALGRDARRARDRPSDDRRTRFRLRHDRRITPLAGAPKKKPVKIAALRGRSTIGARRAPEPLRGIKSPARTMQ